MAKKKTDEVENAPETEATEESVAEVQADDAANAEAEVAADAPAEVEADAPAEIEASTPAEVEAETAPVEAEEKPTKAASKKTAEPVAKAASDEEVDKNAPKGKRAEKIGVVSSDKMTLTVVVRVDRLVKHPIYRKYVRKRKKFMAHDEMGAKIGDKVRIIETRPLSARKRWRVVEIIQKAEL